MSYRTFLRLGVFVASFALAVSSIHVGAQQDARRGRKYKVPPASARIEVTVVRAVNGKPVEHAAVIFHPIEGDRDKGIMELKTNEEGKTMIDVIPLGDTVRLQIIAKGFQTYGQDYKIDKDSMTLEIRLKRPGEQYSIYKPNGDPVDSGTPATPPAAAKSSGTPGQADNQSAPAHAQPN